MRVLILLPSFLSILFLNAQTWCPPGATWWHDYGFFTTVGETITTYEGDTLIANMTCQKLSSWMSGYEMGSNDPVEFHHGTFFTTVQDDVVQLVENDTATDTIFYFGAEIGDRWHGSPISDIEARYRYVVEDLGTKLLNGTSVKWWYIDIQLGMLDMFDHFTYDTLYERIGFVNAFIIPSHTHVFLEIPAIHGTNCYGDGEVVWSWTPWLNCALTLASPKIDSPQKTLVIRPNPATEKFWIDWPDGVSLGKDPYLKLYDGRGCLIKRARIVDRELPIDLTGSVPGLYHVEISSSDSFQMVTRLVVE